MSINQSTLSATDIIGKLDATIPGSASKGADPEIFKTMLRSKYGIDGQVLGQDERLGNNMITGLEMLGDGGGDASGNDAAMMMLGYGGASLMGKSGGANSDLGFGGMDVLNSKALATLSKISEDPELRKALFGASDKKAEAAILANAGQSAPQTSGESQDAADAGEVRRRIVKNEVRMAVNRQAKHPDDLGRLTKTAEQCAGNGFTADEEELLLAAAGAETLLTESCQTGDGKTADLGPVMASSLERAAGKLSAQYESNGEIDCVGYDRRGGTSYGKYQIASRTGAMDAFIDFLGDKAPDLAKKLEKAGPSNTGGKTGKMPSVWKEIAAADPAGFEALQHEFIRENNYAPALKSIVLTSGVDVADHSYALREVLWSTAVQHGPSGAEKIFSKAIDVAQTKSESEDFDKTVIEEVYKIRSQQFGRHSSRVRSAVQARFKNEKNNAIALLQQTTA